MISTPVKTENLSIGSKVLVNKDPQKIGVIAFIGQTSFAPGEWIGIKLDAPLGKNDGSVQGIKYFQCDADHGLFARIANNAPCDIRKLSRQDSSISSSVSTSGVHMLSTPKVSSPKFKIGDKVRTTGGRVGILRFIGPTEFSAGIWAGIELEVPQGKNDGSVKGKRYFTCKQNHGVFSTVDNVQLLSEVQSNLRRISNQMGSTSSLISNVSSSSKYQSTKSGSIFNEGLRQNMQPSVEGLLQNIREKENHIDQLLQERDIERSEVAQVAAHNEEIEKELDQMRLMCSNLRAQCEEMESRIVDLNCQKEQLILRISEKATRIEDMEFRIAEEEMEKAMAEDLPEKESSSPSRSAAFANLCQNLNSQLTEILTKFIAARQETEDSLKKCEKSNESSNILNLMNITLNKQNELRKVANNYGINIPEDNLALFQVKPTESTDSEMQRLLMQLHAQEAELVDACTHLKEARSKAAFTIELETQLKLRDQELENTKSELSSLKKNSESSEQKESTVLSDLRTCISNLEEQLSLSNEKLLKINSELTQAQNDSKTFIQEVIEMLPIPSDQELDSQVLPESLLELRNWISLRSNQLSTQCENVKSVILELNSKQNQLIEERDILVQQIELVRSEKTSNEEICKTLHTSLQEQIDQLSQERQNLSEKVQDYQTKQTELEPELQKLTKERNALGLELEHSRKLHDEKTNTVFAELEADKAKLVGERDHLEEESKKLKTIHEQLLNIHNDCEIKIKKMAEENLNYKRNIENLEKEKNHMLEKYNIACKNHELQVADWIKTKDDLENAKNTYNENQKLSELKNQENYAALGREKELLQSELEKTKSDFVIEKDDLLAKIELLHTNSSINENKDKEFFQLKEKCDQLTKECQNATLLLEQEKKANSDQHSSNISKMTLLEAKNSELNNETEKLKTNISQLELCKSESEKLKVEIEKLKMDHEVVNSEILIFRSKNVDNETMKISIADLTSKNSDLQKTVDELKSELNSKNNHIVPEVPKDVEVVQVCGDTTDKDQRIEFLNQIIASLHKENENLKQKYNRISSLDDSLEWINGDGLKKEKKYDIRVYCDVCEVFDAHDTVDCPVGEVEPEGIVIPHPGHRKKSAKENGNRVYCEHCGVFDSHDSSECPEPSSF